MCKKLICLVFSILMLGLTGSVYADLVGHWMLDEGSGTIAADSSGNGNDGTLMNNPDLEDPTWIAGVNGGAMEFHGTGVALTGGDFFDCGNDASLHFTGSFSIALWIRPDADDPEGKGLAGGETAPLAKAMDPDWSWQVRYGWGTTEPSMGFQFRATPRTWVYVGQNLERNEWCHIAASYDGTTVKCYFNGVETDSAAMSALLGVGQDSPVLIGSDGWGCDWIGAIDDVRLYDHALSVAEIGKLTSVVVASNPSPSDGAIHPQKWATLGWQPGAFAASHDVYMGDNFDDVNDGVNDTFRGNQALDKLLFVAGFPTFAYPDGLVPGTTYYWRIDEVNEADPNSPWKGDVWSFLVPPKTAYYPDPADGAEFVSENPILTWTPGFEAKLHAVYFGEDFDTVNEAAGKEVLGPLSHAPGPCLLYTSPSPRD